MNDVIPKNFKYGLVALEGVVVAKSVPSQLELEPNLFILRQSPFPLGDHWREWVGSLFAERLEQADLFLVSRSSTLSAAILDDENRKLVKQAHYFHVALLIVKSFGCSSKPIKLTGSNEIGSVGVRQITELECPRRVHGSSFDGIEITEEDLRLAANISVAIGKIYQEKSFIRLKRVLRSFMVGVTESYPDLRLHQFVRCIEGFVLPDIGKTERQMKSRTEVFIGPRFHDLIGKIYDVRSDVEHLHDPLGSVVGNLKKEKIVELLKLSFAVEGIARHLLLHLLKNPGLWPHFADDDALRSFWGGDSKIIWGSIFELSAHMNQFDDTYIPDDIDEDA